MTNSTLPAFPYGAVYFRKSNPPREDWERDYRTAAEDGMNIFRHWFLWSAIEMAPGQYDWEDYDRQLDLAAAQRHQDDHRRDDHRAPRSGPTAASPTPAMRRATGGAWTAT